MKNQKQKIFTALMALLLLVPVYSNALAQDVITIENGEITIESADGQQMIMLDSGSIEGLIAETLDVTMDGLQDVISELDDMQLEVRLGEDNQLSFATEDQMWEMNLDVIFSELGSVLESAFDGVETDDWAGHYHFNDDDLEEEELADELERLRNELENLKQELNQLKDI